MNNLSDNITRRITYRRPELYFIQMLFQLAGDHPVLDNAVSFTKRLWIFK